MIQEATFVKMSNEKNKKHVELIFNPREEIYNNGVVHFFLFLKDNQQEGYKFDKNNDNLSLISQEISIKLSRNNLIISGSEKAILDLFKKVLEKFDERPQWSTNNRYWYDEKLDSLVWEHTIRYSDMNKIKDYFSKKFDEEKFKNKIQSIYEKIVKERNIIQKLSNKEKKERENSLKDLIKREDKKNEYKVICYTNPDFLYSEVICKNRDFSKIEACPICKNEIFMFDSGNGFESLNTSKYFNMSSHDKFFEFNRKSKENNLCVFCYLFYSIGNSNQNLIRIKKFYGVFCDDLIMQYYLTLLCKEVSNIYGIKKEGYNFDKYLLKTEKGHEKFFLGNDTYETAIFVSYVLYNYFKKEKWKEISIEDAQLILFNKDTIPTYFVFNKFRYMFKLLDKCYLEENNNFNKIFQTFFNNIYTNEAGTKKIPYRNLIAKQIINKELFFETLRNLLYSKLKNNESFISKEHLGTFIKIYLEVIKMELNYLDVAREIGDSIGLFSQKIDDLEPVYKLREIATKSSFLEALRNIQFKATKNNEMVFSNENLYKLQDVLLKIDEKNFKDFLNIIAINSVQKYLAVNYAKQKSKEGSK